MSGACSATASYSDGANKSVSASWSSSNTTALYVGSDGSLVAGTPSTNTTVTVSASHTENGVTKTATQSVTVKGAAAVAPALSLSSTSLDFGSAALNTTSTTKTVTIKNTSTSMVTFPAQFIISGDFTGRSDCTHGGTGSLSAGASCIVEFSFTPTATGTRTGTLTITSSDTYSPSYTINLMGTGASATATLTGLELLCPTSMTASSTGNCSAMAVYSDGKKTAVTSGTWTVTPGSAATIDATGMVTASRVTADTPISVNVSYAENGKAVTADKTITIKAAACLANTGEITIGGNKVKQLGESLDVRYRLCNFNKATIFDVYVAVQIPDGKMFFLSSSGNFFGIPTFTWWDGMNKPPAYLAGTLVPDLEGPVLSLPVIPLTQPTGTYTFYAIPVLKGADAMIGFNWVGNLAKAEVTFSR